MSQYISNDSNITLKLYLVLQKRYKKYSLSAIIILRKEMREPYEPYINSSNTTNASRETFLLFKLFILSSPYSINANR